MTGAAGDGRPLAGRRVLITRPRAQAIELVQLLEEAGAVVVIAPTIQIIPPADPRPLSAAAADASQFDWIVFTSANAVDAFCDAASADGPASERSGGAGPPAAPSGSHGNSSAGPSDARTERGGDLARQGTRPRICAVGSRTAERLHERGLQVDLVPAEFRAEGLVQALTTNAPVAGLRVLLPRSDIGRTTVADGLRSAGAIVTDVIAYRTVAGAVDDDAADLRRLLEDKAVDVATFTSGSAVRHFVQMIGPDTASLLRDTLVAVIGPVTAEAARQLGIAVHVQPATYTVAGMVNALVNHLRAARTDGAEDAERNAGTPR